MKYRIEKIVCLSLFRTFSMLMSLSNLYGKSLLFYLMMDNTLLRFSLLSEIVFGV